jgi:hypothetical protein
MDVDISFIENIHQADLNLQEVVFMKGYADVYKDGANLPIDVTLGDILCIANIYQADLNLQGAVCLTRYANVYRDGVNLSGGVNLTEFWNNDNFHHLDIIFTACQNHLLCYMIAQQHHS